MSSRACACFNIYCAGLSAKRVGRVEPIMTAIFGFKAIEFLIWLVSDGDPLTKDQLMFSKSA